MSEPAAVVRPLPLHRDERFRGLIDAQLAITGDLSLDDMLDRIVHAACAVVGARYGALGVIGANGTLEKFIHHGIGEAQAKRIRPPRGEGLLAELIKNPSPIRVDSIAAAPHSCGFPPNHPPMQAFLGVPIRVRGEVFGDLYLADPIGKRFDEDDEELVLALASAAGSAIEHARVFEQAQRSREWLHASGEIARSLLAGADVDLMLEVVTRALEAGDADYGQLVLPAEGGLLEITAAAGLGAEDLAGRVYSPDISEIGQAVVAGRPMRVDAVDEWTSPAFDNVHGYGPAMLAPLVDAQGCRGAIMLVRTAGRTPFTDVELDQAATYAAQVALAMQFADARQDSEWLQLLEERHKLAEDLHDNVMQRLFATGVGLQRLAAEPLEATVAARLNRYIAEMDETIDQIRGRVFGLRSDGAGRAKRPLTRFPRVAGTSTAALLGAGSEALSALVGRGRRRGDWADGTGTKKR